MSRLPLIAALALLLGAAALAAPASAANHPRPVDGVATRQACPARPAPHHATCLAVVRTGDAAGAGLLAPDVLPAGYGRPDLLSAYHLPSTGGSGQTVAVIDAQDDPGAEADLAVYRSAYGLPPCTTANGCFRKIDQYGGTSYPAADTAWATEISLDVDMVSAVCPSCDILLVEASSADMSNLGAAVNQAVSQGAKFVSNGYGDVEDGTEVASDAAYFDHPGVVITAAAGEAGYQAGTYYPASSQYVTAVGGTTLARDTGARGWSESVWLTSHTEGTGSGCSAAISKPAWQHDPACPNRMVSDVAAVADPATGVAAYQTYGGTGWSVYGGTAAAAPIIAAAWALAGPPNPGDRANQYPYKHTGAFYDITAGKNGTFCPPAAYYCHAEPGYDGPTGWGTPNGVAGFLP